MIVFRERSWTEQVPFRDSGNTKSFEDRLKTRIAMAQLAFGSNNAMVILNTALRSSNYFRVSLQSHLLRPRPLPKRRIQPSISRSFRRAFEKIHIFEIFTNRWKGSSIQKRRESFWLIEIIPISQNPSLFHPALFHSGRMHRREPRPRMGRAPPGPSSDLPGRCTSRGDASC